MGLSVYILLAAVGLYLVLEGIIPFLSPRYWRRMVSNMARQSDRALHVTGFILMVFGVILLTIAHHFI
jgi:uncharacterized protein